jgi:archaellum component FlaF (FlaF/FlaG flagellin family)
MSDITNHSKLLGQMAGESGDYHIELVAVTTRKFSHVVIGPDGATVSVCKIRGVDVMTARNYGALKAGYVMCASGDDYFDAITLTAGDAEGVVYDEPIAPVAASVAVANGVAGAAMTPTITFTNAGCSGSKDVRYRTKNAAGTIVQEGTAKIYFLNGSSITVTIPGLTYYATVANGYTFEINLTDSDTWKTSAAFNITA